MRDFMTYDFGIESIAIATFVEAGTGDMVHRARPSHGLAINLGGEKKYTFKDGYTFTVKSNEMVYLPKGSTYQVVSIVPGDCFAINFDLREQTHFPPFFFKVKNHHAIIEHFRQAIHVWTAKKQGYMMKCKAELYQVIYTVQQEFAGAYFPNKKAQMIQPAVEYIHNHYNKELLSIEHLASLCSITPEYFRKLFKSFYGTSPLSYINNLKIARAKELLSSRLYSVCEAATEAGYRDMSHFCREFKKATGKSPGEYTKRVSQ